MKTKKEFYELCKAAGILTQMERRGLIHCPTGKECVITSKGYELMGRPSPIKDIVPFVEEFRSLFPKGVRSGGYLVKGSKSGCIKKMKKFIDTHPEYNRELILNATKAYIQKKQSEGFQYMSLAHNFIEKDGTSQLEAECEDYNEGSGTTDFIKEI